MQQTEEEFVSELMSARTYRLQFPQPDNRHNGVYYIVSPVIDDIYVVIKKYANGEWRHQLVLTRVLWKFWEDGDLTID